MKRKFGHAAAAAAIVGIFGFGGVALANAAVTSPSTSTTPADQPVSSGDHAFTPTAAHTGGDGSGRAGCPNGGGSSSGGSSNGSSGSSGSTGSTAPTASSL
ncbi:MAG: hypothetical protein HYX34_07900 [Actinobacteria bacterium]|nr:hypothetical protein [Actinomycetota bacterium]